MTTPSGNPVPGSEPKPNETPNPSPAPTDWRASLPEDLRGHKTFEKFKDPAEVARAYVQLEGYQGRSVVIPGKDAKPEEVTAFYGKLGVPESAEKYELTKPEGVEFDPAIEKDFKGIAHQLHLTQAQVAGLQQWFMGSPMGNPDIASEKLEQITERDLRAEWGGAFDFNMKLAQRAVKEVGGKDVYDLLHATGLGNHPAIVRMFHRLGREYAEDGTFIRDAQSGGLMTPADAQAKIRAIMSDPKHPYHSGVQAAIDEVRGLYQLAHPAGA